MAANAANGITRALRSVVRASAPAPTDRELLRRFADGDQGAFADLVARHAGMVLGVCRRALPTVQDAEDACQATFLVLARKSAHGRWESSLANWLYTTARHVTAKARLAATRRQARERKAARPEVAPALDQMTGRGLLAVLDEELDRLPAIYRGPLVLCYLEGLTREQAAARLGVPAATLKSQLDRGRRKLGEALARRGVTAGAGLLLIPMTSPAGALPPRLVESVLASVSGSPPAAVAALAKGVLVNGFVNRSVWAILTAAAVAWLGIGAWLAQPTAAAPEHAAPSQKADDRGAERALAGRVVDPDGKPVEGARVALAEWVDEKPKSSDVATTDAAGRFRCNVAALPKGRQENRSLVARAKGFAADWVMVRETGSDRPIELRLARATVSIRGRVLTLEGKPVRGAVVRLTRVAAPDGKSGLKELYAKWVVSPNEAASLLQKLLFYPTAAGLPEAVTASADGAFEIRDVGDGRLATLEISGDAIETVVARVATDAAFDPKVVRFDPNKADPSIAYPRTGPPLYGPRLDHTARPDRIITGTVVDKKTRKPIANIAVTGRVREGWWELGVYTKTDDEGRFRVRGLPNAECELTFGSSRPTPYLMLTKSVPATPGLAPATIEMPMVKGVVITGRVSDKTTAEPIRGGIRYATLSGNKHVLDLPGKEIHADGSMTHDLDADGRFRFVAPPGPGVIVVQTRGWRGEGKPYPQARIRAEDKNKPYLRSDLGGLGDAFITSGGIYLPLSGMHGYRIVEPAVGAASLTADLQLAPGVSAEGKVVGPDGQPFPGATVAGLTGTFERPKTLREATFTAQALLADETRTVVAAHAGQKLAGTAIVRPGQKEPAVLKLGAWGALTGRLVDAGGAAVAGATVRLYFNDSSAATVYRELTGGKDVTTDAKGRFRCDVPFAGVTFGVVFFQKGKFLDPTTPKRDEPSSVKAGETKALDDVEVKAIE